MGDVGSALGGVGKFAIGGAAALLGATVAIGGGLLDLAKDAAPIEGITNAFKALATSAGQDSDALIAHMTKVSMGLVDDGDLMTQYTRSAQLMGATLAGQLPDAYQYLAKVAAASGQDVGVLMDDLVNGVGRVTPKIMTQLGVTVDMEAANKAYAASIGKNVDQLSKSDKQTAIFNATMVALKKNTAAMPDVTNLASTKMQQFNIKFADMKETLGTALLPMLGSFMDLLSHLADTVLPIITPIIETLGSGFQTFFQALNDGVDPLTALGDGLYKVFGEGVRPIVEFLSSIGTLLSSFFAGLSEGVNPLEALGAALLDAFGNNPFILGFANALLGIRDALEPILEPLSRFVAALQAGVSPGLALQGLLRDLLPKSTADGIITSVNSIGSTISGIWAVAQPALQSLWLWFIQNGLPWILQALADFKANFIQPVIDKLGELWGAIKPKFDDLPKTFQEATNSAITLKNMGLLLLIETLSKASIAAQELGKIGLFVMIDTLNKAAVSAGLLVLIIEIGVLQALHDFNVTVSELPNKVQAWIDKQTLIVRLFEDFIIALLAVKLGLIAYTALAGLAASISLAMAGGVGIISGAIAALLSPLAAVIIALTGLIALYHEVARLQASYASTMDQGLASVNANHITRQQFLDRAFASSVSQLGDAGARIVWGGTNPGNYQGVGGQAAKWYDENVASGAINFRDSGGFGRAGGAYMIGRGAQPEMFIPSSNGTFIPNADKAMGGTNVNNPVFNIYANDYAGGQAAMQGATDVLSVWQSRGNR